MGCARICAMSLPRIMLVDDQRDVSRMLRSSLELSGREYIIVDVPSGEEALLELGRGPIDLLVTDVMLPGITGIQLLVKVRQLNPEARAILITGHPSDEIREQAESLGVVAFLKKPIGTNFFVEAVERALELRAVPGSPVHIPEEEKPRVADHLDAVRGQLGAEATVLIDNRGQVAVTSGNLMTLDLEAAMPSIMAAFSAGLKTSNLLGSLLPGNLQYFDGDTHDLYLTNVGAFYALLNVFRGSQEAGKMGVVVHYGRRAAEELVEILSDMGTDNAVSEEAEMESEGESAKDQEMKPTDSGEEEGKAGSDIDISDQDIERDDAEEYWDHAVSDSKLPKGENGDMLTYQEARDLGLLTEDSDDEA